MKDIYSGMLVVNSLLLLFTLAYVPLFLGIYRGISVRQVRLDAVRQVRITDADIRVVSSQVSATVPWKSFRDLREYPEFFILAITRSLYWWLPRKEMPAEALELVRNVVRERGRT